jgi:lipopolysaccharide transport system ATP-binding protein
MSTAITIEKLSKQYRLGTIGNRTLYQDINRWWARMRGNPDPLLKIGDADHNNREGEYIWALKDVNFQVQQGETVGIIGRNGAGKSTLLKILSQVTAPTTGVVKVKGRIASLLEVGTGFHPELTGRENIFLNGAILGMSKVEIRQKFDEIVVFAEVEKFIDTPVKRYSSGMYVRLAFAVAAHLEPEILVVDEVLAVGDIAFQKKCLGKMGNVAQEGRTVLFVSHNMVAIESLCSKSVYLDEGSVMNIGDTRDVISDYLKPKENVDSVNLEFSKNRTGTGAARITNVLLKDSIGVEINTIPMGDPFYVEVYYKGGLKRATVAIIIGGVYNDKIIEANSYFSYNAILDLVSGKYVCHFKKNILLPGVYNITAYLGRFDENVDTLKNCLEFNVEPADVYGTGHAMDQRCGIVYVDHDWDFENKKMG